MFVVTDSAPLTTQTDHALTLLKNRDVIFYYVLSNL